MLYWKRLPLFSSIGKHTYSPLPWDLQFLRKVVSTTTTTIDFLHIYKRSWSGLRAAGCCSLSVKWNSRLAHFSLFRNCLRTFDWLRWCPTHGVWLSRFVSCSVRNSHRCDPYCKLFTNRQQPIRLHCTGTVGLMTVMSKNEYSLWETVRLRTEQSTGVCKDFPRTRGGNFA